MFSKRKFYGLIFLGCLVSVSAVLWLPGSASEAISVIAGFSVALLVLEALHRQSARSGEQCRALKKLISENHLECKKRFGENEARVRQLGQLALQTEAAIQSVAQAQNAKFGENEARVRQIGSLLRESERSLQRLLDMGERQNGHGSEEIGKRALSELRFQVLNDLAVVRRSVEQLTATSNQTSPTNFGL